MMSTIPAVNDDLIELIVNDPQFDIRADGTIWTTRPKRNPTDTYNGLLRRCDYQCTKTKYMKVRYKKKLLLAHRIVYRKHVGDLSQNLSINHKDRNKTNNAIENLELVTHADNMLHAKKIMDDDIREIRNQHSQGYPSRLLARDYNITVAYVNRIVSRRCRLDVP
jgi:hypothetical protein